MSSHVAVRGIQASPPPNDYTSSQDVITVDSPQLDSTAQNWHDPSQILQPLMRAGRTTFADEPLLSPGNFTTSQSQDTRNFYTSCGTHNSSSEMPHDQGLISMPLPVINGDSPLSANNIWADPPWLIGYDFDLDALNTSVSATLNISQPLFQSRIGCQNIQPILEGQLDFATETQQRYNSGNDKVRASWFTQIELEGIEDVTHSDTNTRQLTPVTDRNQYDIGDNLRSRITARLRAPTFDDPLPSTKFLVSWLLLCVLYSHNADEPRTILSRFISLNSTIFSPLFTDRHFTQVLRTLFYCCPLRLLVVCCSDRGQRQRKEPGYSKGSTKLSWLL
jgi:hypothetical protein